jgi:hypothetical protein
VTTAFWLLIGLAAAVESSTPPYCTPDLLGPLDVRLLQLSAHRLFSGSGFAMVDRTAADMSDEQSISVAGKLGIGLIRKLRDDNATSACLGNFDYFPKLRDPRAPLEHEQLRFGCDDDEWFRRAKAMGVVEFSRPVFSADHKQALVLVGRTTVPPTLKGRRNTREVRTLNFVGFDCENEFCVIRTVVQRQRTGHDFSECF